MFNLYSYTKQQRNYMLKTMTKRADTYSSKYNYLCCVYYSFLYLIFLQGIQLGVFIKKTRYTYKF